MNFDTFKRIVTSFADRPADVDVEYGTLVSQIRDELVTINIFNRAGELYCKEQGETVKAYHWVLERLGRFQNLARRILDFLPQDPYLIPISSQITDLLERNDSPLTSADDTVKETLQYLDTPPAGLTSVVYLTSDAGEGKTSVITAMARYQAERYLDKESDWLLLPVALGGRPFIRLDDLIVGTLSNRLRFPFLYYDSVVELVKIGSLVLALDGFEEMFVETQAGDAVSSLGNLVSKLDSSGRVLIAARTAYYNYKEFDTQAKLFRSLGRSAVGFAEISLDSWSKSDFIGLTQKMGMTDGEALYNSIASRLGPDHPLLTRAVLARRLVQEYRESNDPFSLLERLASAEGEDYFKEFVSALIQREANEKWIDRQGEAAKPLMSVDEHHLLLSFIAEEMWRSGTASLSPEVLELITELAVGDALKRSAVTIEQAKQRVSQHALLRKSETSVNKLEFDHDDFRSFYIGWRVGELLMDPKGESSLRSLLQVSTLPSLSVRVAANRIQASSMNIQRTCQTLCIIAGSEGRISHVRDNCGQICLRLASEWKDDHWLEIKDLFFHRNSLCNISIKNVIFRQCVFERTDITKEAIRCACFMDCEINGLGLQKNAEYFELEFDENSIPGELTLTSPDDTEDERAFFDPLSIRGMLATHGVKLPTREDTTSPMDDTAVSPPSEEEQDLVLAARAMRVFQRATAVNETIFKLKLGTLESNFFSDILPELLRAGVLRQETYKGSGTQRRFRLNVGFDEIDRARASSKGSFQKFIEIIETTSEQ